MKPKKLFAILLSLALVVGMIPAFTVPAAAAPKYNVIVENGIADNVTTEEENITQADHLDHIYITHNNPPAGMVFDHWELVEGEIFAFEQKKKDYSLAFQMPAQDIHVRAVYVEATELVDTVVLTGGKAPKVGESASYPITGITCLTSDVTINTNENDLCWIYYSPANSPTFLNQGAPFDSETEYFLEVNLRLNPTMGKAWADKVQVTLDGKPAIESKTHTVGDGFFLRTMFIFGKPEGVDTPDTVNKIVMTLNTPVAGEKPASTMWCAGAEVDGLTWYRQVTTERGILDWEEMLASATFQEGKKYLAKIELVPSLGYVFPELTKMSIILNNQGLGGGVTSLTENEMVIQKEFTATAAQKNPFVDVSESDYFYEPVLWAVDKGITNGTDATHFSPAATCTRGQVVTFLWRAAGSPTPTSTTNPFTDVTSSDYYYNAVLWAVGKNITKGTSTTTFGPNDGCTRGQVVTFLHRFENTPAPASSTNPFVDVSSSEYYYAPVLWAVGKGITNGTDATHFSPNDTCTRGQIVTFLYRDMK